MWLIMMYLTSVFFFFVSHHNKGETLNPSLICLTLVACVGCEGLLAGDAKVD